MANVLHGDAGGNQLNAAENRTQVYGLQGNDTLTADGKSDVLLVGGSGDDKLIMLGGNGTLAGGAGADTFELNYSATKKLSAVIEDLVPSEDKIVVNFDGNTAPQISSSTTTKGNVILRDNAGNLNVTLNSVRQNDYLDSDISDEAWEVLRLTNDVRETNGKSLLTASEGLTAGAQIRAVEISDLAETGALSNHMRPDNKGEWYTVLDDKYNFPGENLEAGASSPVEVVEKWMDSEAHKENILDERFQKLGVGYNYYDGGSESSHRYHWTQLFADKLTIAETVPAADLLTVVPEVHTVSKAVTLTEGDDTYENTDYGVTIAALGGADQITNTGGLLVSISGGADNDYIYNYDGRDVTIHGDAGNDMILTSGDYVTINGGTGNDLIGLSGNTVDAKYNVIEYRAGDGNDTIGAFNSTSTLKISGAEYTPWTIGNDLIVVVGSTDKEDFGLLTNEFISLRGSAYLSPRNIEGTRSKLYLGTENADYINNDIAAATLIGFGGNDYINVGGSSAIAEGGVGNDTIVNFAPSSTRFVSNATIYGGEGNDSIRNNGASAFIDGGDGNDYLNSALGPNVTISGGSGKDSIFNNMMSNNAVLYGGDGDDSIQNTGYYSSIEGSAGNDTIVNFEFASRTKIDGNEGNDRINNYGSNSTINGGSGNDTINNLGSGAIIDGSDGNDGFNNYSGAASINMGAGNDSIYNEGSSVTILSGKDNDVIILSNDAQNNLIRYAPGDGRDTIVGFGEDDTLQIGLGIVTYSSQTSGDHININVGTGSVVLWNAAGLSVVNIDGTRREAEEQNERDNYIQLTENPDDYTNTLEGAVIFALGGDDTIENPENNVVILSGTDNDGITNEGNNVMIFGEEGDDHIGNNGSNVSISSDEGADFVINFGENVLILGGDDKDTVYQGGSNGIIIGGAGDDEISLNEMTITDEQGNQVTLSDDATNNLIEYAEGDGNDTVWGFGESDTLRLITDPSNYSTQMSGFDVIVNVGSESITLAEVFDAVESVLPALNIVVASGGSGTAEKYIPLTEGDDNYTSTADGVTIAALGGNDSVTNYGSNVSIDGAGDNDTINNRGTSNTLLGGSGEDSIRNNGLSAVIDSGDDDDVVYTGTNATISTGDGDDSIRSGSQEPVSIVSGAGNDTIYNGSFGRVDNLDGDNATIESGTGDDSIVNYGWSVAINAGDDNDYVYNVGLYVTIDGGAGNDNMESSFSDCSIVGGDGDDTVWNTGENVTIDGGAGNDKIDNNDSDEVSISGGAGNDTIENDGLKVTINAGTGNDLISLSSSAQNNLIQYTPGDGDDTIWGFNEFNRLQIGDGTSTYSTQTSGDDIVVNVGTGSITLINFRGRPEDIIIGEQGTEGGGSGGNSGGDGGGSSSGNNGGRGGNDGGNVSGGTSANEGRNSDASGGRSAVGSRGRSSSTSTDNGGNNVRVTTSSSVSSRGGGSRIATGGSTVDLTGNWATSTQPTTETQSATAQRVYSGGNQVVGDYVSGEKIVFGDVYTGSFYDGAGNFFVGSSTGALVIQNAADKVVDLTDAVGNSFIKAYSATTAGVIDGRGLTGFEIINGSAGSDAIFAGDGGSQLWGGLDVAADTMVGGGGADIFIGGQTQGADIILNASATDIVHLNDANLSDIIATEEQNGAIAVAFNTGNVVAVQSTEALSAAFMLADGSAYRYNHANKSWQTA